MKNTEKRRSFIIDFIYWGLILGLVFFFLTFVGRYLMPFVIGFIIAFTLKPIITKITNKLGDRKWVSLIVILAFYTVFAFALFWLFLGIFASVQKFAKVLPSLYQDTLYPALEQVIVYFSGFMENLNPSILSILDDVAGSLFSSLESIVKTISGGALNGLTKIISSVPSLLISVLVAIISSFFFTMDYRTVVRKPMSYIPEKQRRLILDIKDGLVSVLGKYARAYAILMTVTFIELSIGFFILKVNNPIGMAAAIAAVDILPVLGTGGIVIPWVIVEAVTGNVSFAIGLLVLYGIITLVRNILEPKIIGDQIGLHPLLTLASIFVGVKLFGFWGLFALPMGITIIKTLHDEGKIEVFKNIRS